jgi:hypothetical protein
MRLIQLAKSRICELTRSYPRRFTFYVAWSAGPFARLMHCRRIVVQRLPWFISLSLDCENRFCGRILSESSDEMYCIISG